MSHGLQLDWGDLQGGYVGSIGEFINRCNRTLVQGVISSAALPRP